MKFKTRTRKKVELLERKVDILTRALHRIVNDYLADETGAVNSRQFEEMMYGNSEEDMETDRQGDFS